MSDKDISKFNDLLSEFIDKLINQFEYNEKLSNYRKAFILFKLAKPDLPVNMFMSGTIDYKDKIKNRDEAFFLSSTDIDTLSKRFGNFTEEIGLAYYWHSLTSKTKKAIWDYVQSLFVLGELIINKNDSTFQKYRTMYSSEYQGDIDSIRNGNITSDFIKKIS